MQWWIQVLASTVLFNLFKMCEVLITDNFAFIHKSENFTWSYVEKSSLLPPFYGISCNKNILIFLRLGVANDGCFKVSGEDIQTATGLIWRTEHFLCSGLSRKLFFAITGLVRITSFQNHSKTVLSWHWPAGKHPHSCLLLPSATVWGENRRKVRRLVDQDDDSLTESQRCMCKQRKK